MGKTTTNYFWIILLTIQIQVNPVFSQCFSCKNAPAGTIWCDDFEEDIPFNQKYFEYNNNGGDFIRLANAGRDSSYGMRVKWQAGEVGAGSLSKSFGKTPDTYIGKNAAHPGETFDEIYWRMDVKSQSGWIGGGPAKLSRAMCLANSNWAQGMMAHLWSGGTNDWYLGMDPASGIGLDGSLKSTKYNDFNNLRWLGFKAGKTPIYHENNAGKWFCIVGHVKLNTPGQKNGIFEFWINDTLQASSTNLDWHSTWNNNPNNLHINAIFFENYWNDGSPVEQERYMDNLLISTKPIKCACDVTTQTESTVLKASIHVVPFGPNKIRFQGDLTQFPLQIIIYNMNHQIVKNETITSPQEHIDLEALNPALYILHSKQTGPVKLAISK